MLRTRDFLFLIFLLSLHHLANAQEEKIHFGIKAGLNIADLKPKNSIQSDFSDRLQSSSRTNFHFGMVAEFPINTIFSIQPELMYSAQGARLDSSFLVADDQGDGILSASIQGKLKYDYIILPIMCKYYLFKGFTLEAGPQIGFLVSARENSITQISSNDGIERIVANDQIEYFKSIDFAIQSGLGYQFDFGLFTQARYLLGLSNIDSKESDTFDINFKNSVFQFSLGYKF